MIKRLVTIVERKHPFSLQVTEAKQQADGTWRASVYEADVPPVEEGPVMSYLTYMAELEKLKDRYERSKIGPKVYHQLCRKLREKYEKSQPVSSKGETS